MQLIVCLLVAFSLCISAQAKPFNVRLSSAPQSFDWNSATTGSESAVILNLMDGLFRFDSHLVPVLAQSYTWSADSKTLEIKLKKNIVWQDGTRLKAQHFLDSFERLLNPIINSKNASLIFDVAHARDYFYGKTKNFSEVGISAPKDDVLKFTLTEPRANFLNILTHWATFPYRKDKPTQTLGAYQLVQKQGSEVWLKSNPKYFGKAPRLKEIHFEAISSGEIALKSFQEKKIDYLLQLEDELLDQNKGLAGLGFVDAIRVVALLHFNPSRVSTNSAEKRRSIMAAISTQSLIEAQTQTRVPAASILPEHSRTRFTPQKSDLKLPETSLTLGYPNDALSLSVAEKIQATSKNLKIRIEALPQNETALKRYDLIFTLFGLDYFDPDQLFSAFLSQGSLDFFNFNSADFLALVQQARRTQNDAERAKINAKAADYLQNQVAVVMPLFYRRRAFLLNPQYRMEAQSRGSPLMSRIIPK